MKKFFAASNQLPKMTIPAISLAHTFQVQWMADNVDHNPFTLDRKGSLHAMGIAAATTNAGNTSLQIPKPINRKHRKPIGHTC
jgi:hypothetical protein